MFLVAITKHEIIQNFKNIEIEELRIHPFIITIVTDNVLSKYIPLETGFSIIESLFFSSPETGHIIFSQGTYHHQDHSFEIGRSTISGRPIFYTMNQNGEFYCSTHISLLRTAGVPIEENTSVLPEFFIYRHIMPPKTLYKNIQRILLGGQLQIRLENDKCVIHQITKYIPPNENQQIQSITKSAEELYNYLTETIPRLAPVKNNTTVLLSGGIDSSVISTIYKKIFALDTSYSTGYPFESSGSNTEKRYALSAGLALKMNHHYYEPSSAEYLTGVLEAISYAEEPLHHLQSTLLHLLWKNEIPSEQRIILCAQGAGSTFGNNEIFYINEKKMELFYRLLINNSSLYLVKMVSQNLNWRTELVDIIEKLHHNYPLHNSKNPLWSWMDYGNWDWVRTFFNVTTDQIIRERYEFIKELTRLSLYDIWSRYSLYGDEDVTLGIWSKIGEADKKIIYFPFYDHTVLDYAFSIPWQLKIQTPRILTKELGRQSGLPNLILNRPKSSFAIESKHWAENGGIFDPLIPLVSKIIDEKEIRKMQSSDPTKAMTFWNILNYSVWKRLQINKEPLEVLSEELNSNS
jgi:asparagine synthase (glutamine-hydrolysing)